MARDANTLAHADRRSSQDHIHRNKRLGSRLSVAMTFGITGMPSRPCVDPLLSALAAPKVPARFRDDDILWQGIHVHVGLMLAGFTRCDHHPDAIRAHICQRHRRESFFAHSRRTCSAGLSSRSPT
jgi:hypothetical protein